METPVKTKPQHSPSKFVFADHVKKGLDISFETNQNIILHGPGK